MVNNESDKKPRLGDVDSFKADFQEAMQKYALDTMQNYKTGKMDMGEMMNYLMGIVMVKQLPKLMGADEDSGKNNGFKEQFDALHRRLDELQKEKEIEKATQPLKEQIAELKNMVEDKGKANPEMEKLHEEVKGVGEKLTEMEKTRLKEEYEDMKNGLLGEISGLKDTLESIRTSSEKGDPIETMLSQFERVDKYKSRLGKWLGVPEQKAEQMDLPKILDEVVARVPETANAIRKTYDIMHGEPLTDDETPPGESTPDMTQMPVANRPTKPELPDDLKQYFAQGIEKEWDPKTHQKIFVDPYGNPIVTPQNEPMTKAEFLSYAIDHPDDIRAMMKQSEDILKKKQQTEEKQESPEHNEEVPQTPEPEPVEEKQPEPPKEEKLPENEKKEKTEIPDSTTAVEKKPKGKKKNGKETD